MTPEHTKPFAYIDDDGVARVADELSLGHLVLDVGGGQVDGEEDQGEAEHVDRVHCHTKSRVALTKSDGKLLKKSLKVSNLENVKNRTVPFMNQDHTCK